jgi:hypothetical protein
MRIVLYMLALAPLLGGCVVKTAANVVTLPVRAGAQAADWATTSQDEADRNAGRKAREEKEREAKAARKAEKERRKREERDER